MHGGRQGPNNSRYIPRWVNAKHNVLARKRGRRTTAARSTPECGGCFEDSRAGGMLRTGTGKGAHTLALLLKTAMATGPVRFLLSKLLSSSFFKRRIWSRWYSYLEDTVGEQPIWFLNYGYCPSDSTPVPLNPGDESNRLSIQLYDVVTRDIELAGRNILEVSCGRGGGARYIHQYRKPAMMIGLDRTEKAVAYCNRQHGANGLRFVCGDAQQLPFPAGYFHAVVNVEASHCYPDVARFLAEVHRVLRPGGHFLYADMRKSQTIASWRQQIKDSGFAPLREQEITPDVVRALEQSHEHVSEMIQRSAPRLARRFFSHFAATKGTGVYNQLQSGAMQYIRHVLVRPG